MAATVRPSDKDDKNTTPGTDQVGTNTTKIGEVDRPGVDRDERRKNDSRDYKDDLQSPDRHPDGSVSDETAKAFLKRQVELSVIAPNERGAVRDAQGTPAALDEESNDDYLSDGGPTLVRKANSEAVAEFLDDAEDALKRRLKRNEDKKSASSK